MQWEYLIERIIFDQPDLEKGLDKQGDDGWELVGTGKTLVSTSTTREVLLLFFKRPKRQPAPTVEAAIAPIGDSCAECNSTSTPQPAGDPWDDALPSAINEPVPDPPPTEDAAHPTDYGGWA